MTRERDPEGAACQSAEGNDENAKKGRRGKGSGYDGPNPCERLSAGVISAGLGITVAAVKTQQGSFAKEVCTATWDKPNAAALQARQQQDMLRMMKERMAAQREGREIPPIKVIRTDNEVTLTYGRQVYKSKAEAGAALQSAMAVLTKGITRTVDVKVGDNKRSETATFQADSVPVDGLGDQAYWTQKLGQLAVLDGKGFFFLSVRLDDDDNREADKASAIKLARKLLTGKGARP